MLHMDGFPVAYDPPALFLIGALLPFVTALVTKFKTPDWQKGLVSMIGACLAGTAISALSDGTITWETWAQDSVTIWLTHLATWLGVSSQAVAKLNQATGRYGIRLPIKTNVMEA